MVDWVAMPLKRELEFCVFPEVVGARIPEDQVDADLEDCEDSGMRIPADQSEEVLATAGLEFPEGVLSDNRRLSFFGGCGLSIGGGWYPGVLVLPPSKGLGWAAGVKVGVAEV